MVLALHFLHRARRPRRDGHLVLDDARPTGPLDLGHRTARLVLEWLVLGGGAFLLWRAGRPLTALLMFALIAIDHTLQYDRVARLVGS
jgi:hypothetical protein